MVINMNDRLLNDWKIISRNTDGEFSIVYKVVRDDGFVCAIKVMSLPRSENDMNQLINAGIVSSYEEATNFFAKAIQDELDLMKKFNGSPNILNFFEFTQEVSEDQTCAKYYLRMEYAEDIKSYFLKNGVSQKDVVKLAIDICTALELISNNNVTHNDIKPANIFIDNYGNFKLGDFGIASDIGSNKLVTFGTLNYVSPEVYNKKSTLFNSDIYSLGLVMYKLLAGDLPFVGGSTTESKAIEIRMSGREIPPIEGVNKQLMEIISRACNINPQQRYSNASEMKGALMALTNLSDKKQKISFASSVIENTISIYDKELLLNQNFNIDVKNVKEARIRKISKNDLIKRCITIAVVVALLLGGGFVYRLNRTCPTGEINKLGSCVKGYYYCDTGYFLSGDKCRKTIETIDAKAQYTCKDGYTRNGDVCINNDIREPKPYLKCAVDGYTLNNNTGKCEMTISADASPVLNCNGSECVTTASKSYSCADSSYKLNGTKCTKGTSSTVAAKANYSCAAGGTLAGTICNYTTDAKSSGGYWGWGGYPTCDKGQYNYVDKKCHYSEPASLTYSCSQGTLSGSNCIVSGDSTVDAKVSYSCPKGYSLVLESCVKSSEVTKYVCPDNAVLKGKKCYTTTTMDSITMYKCDEGFVLAGTQCVKNEEVKAVKKYTCSKVYTVNGDKCEKYNEKPAKVKYTE